MKLPPRAHTFNFPPRGRAHPPRAQPFLKPVTDPFTTGDKPPTFPPFRFSLRKAPAFLFLVTSDTNTGPLANKRHGFFYRCHARYQRPFHRCHPPLSVPLLSLGTVGVVDSMFDMASALSGSIGHVTKDRLPSSLTCKSMVMPALALKRIVQAARERWSN